MSGNAPKIVIVVLVVVVVLFALGIGVGAGGGIGGISLDGVINTFAGLLPIPALDLNEVSASPSSCLNRTTQRIVIPNGGSCTLDVAESSANVRALKLRIASGASVALHMTTQPDGEHNMDIGSDLPSNGNSQITLNFYKASGELKIENCTSSGSGCVIDIAQ